MDVGIVSLFARNINEGKFQGFEAGGELRLEIGRNSGWFETTPFVSV